MTQIDARDGLGLGGLKLPSGAAGSSIILPRLAPPRFALAAYRRAFMEAVKRGQLAIAGALVNTRHACPGFFRFVPGSGPQRLHTVIRLEFRGGHCTLALSPHLSGRRLEFVTYRLLNLLAMLAGCRDAPAGSVALNTDDYGLEPGLAFSDARPDRWLIPDPIFLAEDAYQATARHYLRHDVPWSERRRIAFWRGATTGGEIDCAGWEELDRVRLCRIAEAHPSLFDAGLWGLVQLSDGDIAAVQASGLVRNFVPETRFHEYRYQIDIDGNTNSWPGLFQKLLTGSPVMKVTSRHGHRQWYYDRLVPWENFVPVSSDMSDLVEKTNWLIAHDTEAQRIGAAGRALALSMSVPAELNRARATVYAAIEQSGTF